MPRRGRNSGGSQSRFRDYPFDQETKHLLDIAKSRGVSGDWDDVVNRVQDILENHFSVILQYVLEADLEDSWMFIVKEKPPWTPIDILSVIIKNDSSCTDQGFNTMLRAQADYLSSLLKSLSYDKSPGAALALQIVRLIHDMFFSAPKSFRPCATDPPVSISCQEANEAKNAGFSEAKALYQECAEMITSGANPEEACAWEESEMGDLNMATWPGANRNEQVHSPPGRYATSTNFRGPPHKTLESTRSAPPGMGPTGYRPPIVAGGRGLPPGMRQDGTHISPPGRGPPPGIAHRPQMTNTARLHPRAPPGIVTPDMATGQQHHLHPGPSRDSNPAFSSSESLGNFSAQYRGPENEARQWQSDTHKRPMGLPGQPPLGSVQPLYSENQGPPGYYENVREQRMEMLQPSQPPAQMPGLRGRPAGGRGPPPNSRYRVSRNVAPKENPWEYGADMDAPLPRHVHGDPGAGVYRPQGSARNGYSGKYYGEMMDGGGDVMDSEFWSGYEPNDAENG